MTNLGTLNEKSTGTISLNFVDETGTAVIPTTGSYRIDTIDGFAIKAPTAFSPTTDAYTLNLSVADNTLHDAAKSTEYRIVTVTWTYGSYSQATDNYKYGVKNLAHVS